MTTPLAVQLADAARLAGVSVDTLRAACRSRGAEGEPEPLAHSMIGGRYVVRIPDLDDWLIRQQP